ncbi:MAG: MFS transporter [Candidatus Poribacteria bacterium]|nr:MFS transporter [Candidatus Poribacteria bacterium]MDE0506198.1 MFS transporter [Candidatus Poribacteria bacterium]
MSFTLIDAATILPAFVHTLTQSKILVGLTGSLQPAGWMWPQLLMSNLLEHRPRKMKFYALGMSVRISMWLVICLAVILIGARRPVTLAVCFLLFYFIAASAMGVSTIPYMDIISKAFSPRRRTQFFSLRQLYGGLCGILLGFFIRAVLGKESEFTGPFGGVTRFFKSIVNFFVFSVFGLDTELSFPYTYCTLFACAIVTFSLSVIFFLRIREPVVPVQASRQPIRQHLKRGPYFLRIDANYRRLLLLRICHHSAGMSVPFFVPFAMQNLGISEATIGSFLITMALTGVVSNIWWAHVGKHYGVRWVLIMTAAILALPPLFALLVRFLPLSWQTPFYYLVFSAEGAAVSGMWVGFMAYLLNIAPPLSRPTYLGFMNTILFPMSFAPLLGGVLVNIVDFGGLFLMSVACGVLALMVTKRLDEDVYEEDGSI